MEDELEIECPECKGGGIIVFCVGVHIEQKCEECNGRGIVAAEREEIEATRSDYAYDKNRDDKLTGDA